MNNQNPNQKHLQTRGNRFVIPTGRLPYSDKSEYLRAMSDYLTPDIWDAIVARAIHDATMGRSSDRTKAREWLSRHLLPVTTEIELRKVSRTDYNFLSEMYDVFQAGAETTEDIEKALAITIGVLSPEERATLRACLLAADSEEIQKFWDNARTEAEKPRDASRPY